MSARFGRVHGAGRRLLASSNLTARSQQQVRFQSKKSTEGNTESGGVFSQFIKDAKEGDDETKKTVQDLEKKAEELRQRSTQAEAALKEKAAAAQEQLSNLQAEAEKARLAMTERMKEASESLSGTYDAAMKSDYAKSAKAAADDLRQKTSEAASEAADSFKSSTESKEETSGESKEQKEEAKESAFKAKVKGATGMLEGTWVGRALETVKNAYTEEYRLAMMTETEREQEKAETRRKEEEARIIREAPVDGPMSDGTALMTVAAKQSAWEKRFGWMKDTAPGSAAFQRMQALSGNPFFVKAKEFRDDMQDRWETSDNRIVHSLQNTYDSWSSESETATAMRTIRERDVEFDMVRFLARTKEDVPIVLKAYLTGDLEGLKATGMSDEMMERMGGQFKIWEAEGSHLDNKILDVSDMELVEVKMYGENPLIILRCIAQQVNCVRDKFGNITEGAEDDIQSVHYAWAYEQGELGTGELGGPPPWRIREMMVQGAQAIV